MSQKISKEEKDKLQKVLEFTTSISDNKVSYHTTIPHKRVIQGGLIQETWIDSTSKSTSTRARTKEEQLYDLRRVLEL